jgi:protease-4
MAGKKHPITTVLIILGLIALLLGSILALVLNFISPSQLALGDKISVIPIVGPITDSHRITSQLVRFKKDKGIRAIILRIDSPGGAVGPTQEIYKEVQRTTETKKVVASLGGVAASGGYYIAAAADRIVANPATITGSIGVLMQFFRAEELFKKIGVSLEVLKSGEFKDIGSPHRELTEEDRKVINEVMSDIQKQFVEAVAESRNMPVDEVRAIADGRIFSGAKAKDLGLVDILGNFHDAVDTAKNLAGIRGEVELVYPKRSRMDIWDLFFEKAVGSILKRIQGDGTQLQYRWQGFLKRPTH